MRLEYVARHSARGMSAFYKITALWGGMSGSMLFWLFLLVLFSVVAMLGRRIGEQTGFRVARDTDRPNRLTAEDNIEDSAKDNKSDQGK